MYAIIGAGIAGLSAARVLTEVGRAVRVFEKSRGLGGRLATRRGPNGAFDHGAQYASVRDPAFAAYADHAVAVGAAADWPRAGSETRRIVGLPGMSGLAKPLAEGIDIRREVRVTAIGDGPGGLSLSVEEGAEQGPFEAVLCAVPAPQASALLAPHGPPFERIAQAVIAPCWSLMVVFESAPDLPQTRRAEEGAIGWLAHEGAKPGRAPGHRWIVHGSPAFSRAHLEEDRETVSERLTAELRTLAGGALPKIVHASAHRWRYSQVETPIGPSHLLSGDGRIGYCGDACLGGRVEAAFLSGRALAQAMVDGV